MFSVSNVTRRISLWPVSYQWRDYCSDLMQFVAFARAIVCSALVRVFYNRTALSSGRKPFVFKMVPGSNLSAETDFPDWFSACFSGSADESRVGISNQNILGSLHVLSLSLLINHKETTLKTWAYMRG